MLHAISLLPLDSGDAGTRQTVAALRNFVDTYHAHPAVRAAVLDALHGTPEKNSARELGALLEWVRERVRYLPDPVDVEFVQSPVALLDAIRRDGTAAGDCDDMAALYATLAEAAGYATRFVVQGIGAGDYGHVLVEVDAGGRWVAVDPSQRGADVGWRPTVGIGREAHEMLARRYLGQNGTPPDELWPTSYVTPEGTDVFSNVSEAMPSGAPVPPSGGSVWGGLTDVFSSIAEAGAAAIPLLERYGVVKPVVGYDARGNPLYASATLPVQGTRGAAFTFATQPALFGLTPVQLALIGGGVLLLVSMSGRRGRA